MQGELIFPSSIWGAREGAQQQLPTEGQQEDKRESRWQSHPDRHKHLSSVPCRSLSINPHDKAPAASKSGEYTARGTQRERARWLTSSSWHKLNTVCVREFTSQLTLRTGSWDRPRSDQIKGCKLVSQPRWEGNEWMTLTAGLCQVSN